MSQTSGTEINLAGDLPNNAIDLAERKPNVRQEYSTTSTSSSDITSALSSANSNNQLLELDAGTYTMSGSVSFGGVLGGIVGAGSDSTTIEISGTHDYLFGSSRPSVAVIEGVTFDISGGGECAFGQFRVNDAGWFEDIVVRGTRDKIGNGTGRFSWKIEAGNSGATNFIHRVVQADGDQHYSGDDTVGHAIPFSADPGHEGLNVWKECHVQGFTDNGFYVSNSPGQNVLWNCTAKDNRGGNFRVDTSDIIVGGSVDLTPDAPGEATGLGLVVDTSGSPRVIGLQLRGSSYGNLIQIRQEAESVTLDRLVLHGTDSGRLVRFDGSPVDVDILGGWWLDENGSGITVQNANVTADAEWKYEGSWSGSITVAGQTYIDGSGSEAGLGSPTPFPSFHIDGVVSGGGTDYEGGTGGGGTGGGGTGGTGGPQFIDGSGSPGSRWGLTEARTAILRNAAHSPVEVLVEPQWFNDGGTGTGTGGSPTPTGSVYPLGVIVGDSNEPVEGADVRVTSTQSEGAETVAAVNQGWGEPVEQFSSDFQGDSLEGKWSKWGSGSDGEGCYEVDTWNGWRCGRNSVVRDGMHVIEGTVDGETSGSTSTDTFTYGRIEYRERAYCADNCDNETYNVTPIIYPANPDNQKAGNGEMDIAERRIGDTPFFVVHWNDDNYYINVDGLDGTEWHNYAIDWQPNEISWYIDGHFVDSFDLSIDITAEHNAGQMDMFPSTGTPMHHAFYEIDWVKFYSHDASGASPMPQNDHSGGTDWAPTGDNVRSGLGWQG